MWRLIFASSDIQAPYKSTASDYLTDFSDHSSHLQ